MTNTVNVIGAGLAGCEAAWALARYGIDVKLYEMKPEKYTPAHKYSGFAELVCSNSLKAARLESAAGLLKTEMEMLGSLTVPCAKENAVEAGGALAVDREKFSDSVTARIKSDPHIEVRGREVTELPEGTTIIATGPLTNIAAALNREPRIAEKAAGLYIMGGGAYAGNWTPAAEFNIWVDAEAACKVFHSGIDLHMVGVNLTRQCPVDTEFIEGLRSIGAHAATFSAELCDFFSHGGDAHLHDACAVAWVIDPTLIESAYLHVDIELTGTLTRGMTVTDLRFLQTAKRDVDIDLSSTARWDDPPVGSPFRGQAPNTHVAMRLDYGRFVDLVRTTMRNYR